MCLEEQTKKFVMLFLYILMAFLNFLGLLDPWVLTTLGVFASILYFDIVSGLINIDFMVNDCQSY